MVDIQTFGDLNINQTISIANASDMDGKYLSFWTDGQLFGIPIADVVQIVGMQIVTELPEAPYYVKGIMNLRGSIIPIIDMRLRLGKPEKGYDERTCIIITNVHETLIGFVVDEVNEVANIENSEFSPPPKINNEYNSSFLTGVAKRESGMILIISIKKLIGEIEIEKISKAAMEEEVI